MKLQLSPLGRSWNGGCWRPAGTACPVQRASSVEDPGGVRDDPRVGHEPGVDPGVDHAPDVDAELDSDPLDVVLLGVLREQVPDAGNYGEGHLGGG